MTGRIIGARPFASAQLAQVLQECVGDQIDRRAREALAQRLAARKKQ